MPQIELPNADTSTITLAEAMHSRISQHAFEEQPLSIASLSQILKNSAFSENASHRPYPSGGALFPIEIYLLVRDVESLSPGIYHYRPDVHRLEFLWVLSENLELDVTFDAWVTSAPVLIVLTAQWSRSWNKYNDFGLELSLLEAGHIGQNMLLSAVATNACGCPWGGFNEKNLADILDLDNEREQVVYTIALGPSISKASPN
ncbi:MAG: nitroreductase [Parcubacteria group bacterium Gr01-1014_8]|nr:MAG: nitroreductase [Parcubacteria group bacterium Gr01-1014_8]